MRILIAEDDAVSRMILHRSIERLGHECLAASDGAEAWETYQEHPDVDAIISDWMMPVMDGRELCEKVREHAEGREGYPFFIFLTALGDREHLRVGMEAGADDYLSKPLDRDELDARLLVASRVTDLHRRLASQKRDLERLNLELFEQARLDPLTRLGNRLRLREDLEITRDRSARYGHAYCVLLCDVDCFKAYNDRYGHLKGDEVLAKVGGALLSSFRTGDACYRYGGEEFLVILPEQTLGTTSMAAERLRREVEELAVPHDRSPTGVVTVSCGVAGLPSGGRKTVEELLQEADQALYRAKEGGRNRVVVHKEARA